MHSGGALKGIASPAYKGKGFSKYGPALPARMRKDFNDSLENGQLTNNVEIALIEARLKDVLKRVELGETKAIWVALKEEWAQLLRVIEDDGDLEQAKLSLPNISKLIEHGGEDWETWERVAELWESRRKMVETESRILLQQQETLTSNQAHLLYNALLSVIVENVPDRETRSKIQNGFLKIVQGGSEAKRLPVR